MEGIWAYSAIGNDQETGLLLPLCFLLIGNRLPSDQCTCLLEMEFRFKGEPQMC